MLFFTLHVINHKSIPWKHHHRYHGLILLIWMEAVFRVDGVNSNIGKVKFGAMQGSCLDPLFFLIWVGRTLKRSLVISLRLFLYACSIIPVKPFTSIAPPVTSVVERPIWDCQRENQQVDGNAFLSRELSCGMAFQLSHKRHPPSTALIILARVALSFPIPFLVYITNSLLGSYLHSSWLLSWRFYNVML